MGFFEDDGLGIFFSLSSEVSPKTVLIRGVLVFALFACDDFALVVLLIGDVLLVIPVTPQLLITKPSRVVSLITLQTDLGNPATLYDLLYPLSRFLHVYFYPVTWCCA